MTRTKDKQPRIIEMECPYGRDVVFRRSGFSKGAWEHIVHKFGITYEPEVVMSIRIDGEDDFGHLLISVTVE